MNFQLDIQNFLNQQVNINDKTNTQLVLDYYKYKNVTENTTVKQWMIDIALNNYPSYTEIYKLIRTSRRKRIQNGTINNESKNNI